MKYKDVIVRQSDIGSIGYILDGTLGGSITHPLLQDIYKVVSERNLALWKIKSFEKFKNPDVLSGRILDHIKKEEEDYLKFFGHIPHIDPHKAKSYDRVVYRWGNRWTLLRTVKLSCGCCGNADFAWIVGEKKNSNQIQIWNFDDSDNKFWMYLYTPENYKKKLEILPEYLNHEKEKREKESKDFKERLKSDKNLLDHVREISPDLYTDEYLYGEENE